MRERNKKTHLFIYHIERRLIDQSNIKSLLPTPQDSIPRSIKHLSKRNHISSLTFCDNFVFPRGEFIIAFKEPGFSIFLQNPGHLRTGGKDKPESTFEEDMLDDGRHLGCIGREVEEGLHVRKAIVGIKIIDTYVTISIGYLYDSGQQRKPTKMTGVISLYAFNITGSDNEEKIIPSIYDGQVTN